MSNHTHSVKADYQSINEAARANILSLLRAWLPHGRKEGREYLALNPRRDDRQLGSFRINVKTGRWADFATGDRGGDVISLYAYLFRMSQRKAAYQLAELLHLDRGRAS